MTSGKEGLRLHDAAPGQSQTADRSFGCEADDAEAGDCKTTMSWIASAQRCGTFAQDKESVILHEGVHRAEQG